MKENKAESGLSGLEQLKEYQKLHGKNAPIPAKIVKRVVQDFQYDLKLWNKFLRGVESSIEKYAP